MIHKDLLAKLLPPASYSTAGQTLISELSAEGAALDRAESLVKNISITPFNAGSLMSDWERVLGLQPPSNDTYLMRLERVLAKIAEVGGLSIPYFVRLAKAMGFDITIVEPEPFRAGHNRCGDALWSDDIIFCWQVVVTSTAGSTYLFRAGTSAAGEHLMIIREPVIEAVFNDLKPAHTFCYFFYKNGAVDAS